MSIDKIVQQVSQSKNHINIEEESTKAARKAAARKQLSSKKDTTLDKTTSVGDAVVNQNNKPKDGIIKGSNVDNGGDSAPNRLGLKSGSGSDLSQGLSSIGSTSATSGAMDGAVQAGMMSGGNPYAMAGGALMGVLKSRENKKKAEALIKSQVIKEQQRAEERKEAAMGSLKSDIGKAFRGASKGVVI